MRHYIKSIAVYSISFFTISCEYHHKAERTIKDFLDQNMVNNNYSIRFNKIDSTRNLTDSMITVMKNDARKNELFKKNIEYGTGNKPYIFTKVRIYDDNDTMSYTFYLDKTQKSVIAFKVSY